MIWNEQGENCILEMDWYPFEQDAEILQVFSAYNGGNEPSFDRSFDYIVFFDVLAKSKIADLSDWSHYIRSFRPYLKPEGRILIVEENRYGIRNWCGRKETYTKIPFEGICGYPEDSEGKSINRKQLADLVEVVGFSQYRFIYPMPDYNHPLQVYTDNKLPDLEEASNIRICSVQTTFMEDSMVMDGKEALRDIVANGIFPFFANYFVVEASWQGTLPLWKEPLQNGMAMEEEHNRQRRMLQNRRMLGNIDKDQKRINQVVQVQMDLLKELKRVCDDHGLKLNMIYGTLLGAVRHGGMIPGDDDIDVGLYREDFNKLLELTEEFKEPYFLQTPWNDNCFFGGYLKLRNRNTSAIHPQNWWVDCCEGIGIDIFPIDAGYRNPIKEWWKEKRICFYQRLLYAKAYGYAARFEDMPLLIWKAYKYWGKLFTRQHMAERFNRIMAQGDNTPEALWGVFAHYAPQHRCILMERRIYEETVQMPYEDLLLEAPVAYDVLLANRYGRRYMQYPLHQEGRHRHGFYSVDVPYQIYKKRFSGLFRPEPKDKSIVLVGDSAMFGEYYRHFNKKYQPNVLILLDREDVDEIQVYPGTQVKELLALRQMDPARVYLVICSIDIRKAEDAVQQFGYEDYHIFIRNRNWLLLADPEYALEELRLREEKR